MSNVNISKKVRNARIKLSKRSEGLNFFGACAYMFDWQIHSMDPNVEGFVLFDKDNHENLDGIIHINQDLVSDPNYTHNNLAFIVVHELMHILLKHGVLRGNRDDKLWGVACDHVVERDLKELAANIKPFNDHYNIIDELHHQNPKCSVLEAYEWLKNNSNISVTMNAAGPGEGSDQGTSVQFANSKDGQSFTSNVACGGVDGQKVKASSKETAQTADRVFAEAQALNEMLKSRGSGSGGLSEYLDEVLKVKIPWEELYDKAIKTNVTYKPITASWTRPNIYMRPHGITLPGVAYGEDSDGTGILVILTDTSGSISKDEKKKFASVTGQSFKYFKEIWVLVHDVQIKQNKVFANDQEADFLSLIKNEGYKGGGGTSHQYVFDEIEKAIWETDKQHDLSMVISLTDGYSDIESIYKNYKWLKSTPLVVLLTTDYDVRVDSGYGDITQIKIND